MRTKELEMGENVSGTGVYVATKGAEETIIAIKLSQLDKTVTTAPTMAHIQALLNDFTHDAAAINLKVVVEYTLR
jgi:hypothetical protein